MLQSYVLLRWLRWCQHFQNPKAPRPLGRRWWKLVCVCYQSVDTTSRKQHF